MHHYSLVQGSQESILRIIVMTQHHCRDNTDDHDKMITHCQSTIVISASKVSDLSGFNRYADLSKHTFSLSHLLKKIRLEECRNSFEVIWNNYHLSRRIVYGTFEEILGKGILIR